MSHVRLLYGCTGYGVLLLHETDFGCKSRVFCSCEHILIDETVEHNSHALALTVVFWSVLCS